MQQWSLLNSVGAMGSMGLWVAWEVWVNKILGVGQIFVVCGAGGASPWNVGNSGVSDMGPWIFGVDQKISCRSKNLARVKKTA